MRFCNTLIFSFSGFLRRLAMTMYANVIGRSPQLGWINNPMNYSLLK